MRSEFVDTAILCGFTTIMPPCQMHEKSSVGTAYPELVSVALIARLMGTIVGCCSTSVQREEPPMQYHQQRHVIGICIAALYASIFLTATAVGAERVWIGKPGPSCIEKCHKTAEGMCGANHFCQQNYLPNCVSACRRQR